MLISRRSKELNKQTKKTLPWSTAYTGPMQLKDCLGVGLLGCAEGDVARARCAWWRPCSCSPALCNESEKAQQKKKKPQNFLTWKLLEKERWCSVSTLPSCRWKWWWSSPPITNQTLEVKRCLWFGNTAHWTKLNLFPSSKRGLLLRRVPPVAFVFVSAGILQGCSDSTAARNRSAGKAEKCGVTKNHK